MRFHGRMDSEYFIKQKDMAHLFENERCAFFLFLNVTKWSEQQIQQFWNCFVIRFLACGSVWLVWDGAE